MTLAKSMKDSWSSLGRFGELKRPINPRVVKDLLGPAFRGFVLQRAKSESVTRIRARHEASFTWEYERTASDLSRLYSQAKASQWDGEKDLDWGIEVDPHDPSCTLISDEALPLIDIPQYRSLPQKQREEHRYALLAWLLSQFLHGEQGALLAACQITEAVDGLDSKLYGSTQVVDEGRHVEVFHRYLVSKLEKKYEINDNLYVIIDSLMNDSRWDMKFLGMQIMVEGLALGAFTTMRQNTQEPLLRELLKYVITDEARHVHYGVVSLRNLYQNELGGSELKEREDWALEMCILLRNRFLAHEFYDEYYAHVLSRKEWDQYVLNSKFMKTYRASLFRRLIPNLKRIGLLADRLRPHYTQLGLLEFENDLAAPDLHAEDLLSSG